MNNHHHDHGISWMDILVMRRIDKLTMAQPRTSGRQSNGKLLPILGSAARNQCCLVRPFNVIKAIILRWNLEKKSVNMGLLIFLDYSWIWGLVGFHSLNLGGVEQLCSVARWHGFKGKAFFKIIFYSLWSSVIYPLGHCKTHGRYADMLVNSHASERNLHNHETIYPLGI